MLRQDSYQSEHLRTERRRKNDRYAAQDKELLAIDRERRALWQSLRELPFVPLVPAVQKGWIRRFVIRPDLIGSTRAASLETVLEKINNVQWSYRKDFLVKRRKFGKKIHVPKEQYLEKLAAWQMHKHAFTEEQKNLFDVEWRYNKHSNAHDAIYVFREQECFRLKVFPNIIDKIRMKDGMLESRLEEIDQYLLQGGHNYRLEKMLNYHNRHYNDRYGVRFGEGNPLKNQPVQKILDALKEEL
jgi:hypothetical protein